MKLARNSLHVGYQPRVFLHIPTNSLLVAEVTSHQVAYDIHGRRQDVSYYEMHGGLETALFSALRGHVYVVDDTMPPLFDNLGDL